MGVFIPRDRVTLKYCQSWSDSSEPATSHSAVPHTRGQQRHYLPLNTFQIEQSNTHVVLQLTHTVAFKAFWTEGHRQGDLSSWDYSCLVRWQISQHFCHLPWAAGASLTTRSASVVSRGELKFLLKAPRWQARKWGREGGREGIKDNYFHVMMPVWFCQGWVGTVRKVRWQHKSNPRSTLIVHNRNGLGEYNNYITN